MARLQEGALWATLVESGGFAAFAVGWRRVGDSRADVGAFCASHFGGGGRSLADPWPDDVFVQISESGIGRAVRTKRWKYAVQSDEVPPGAEGARSYEEAYLYDLEADPYELRNLIGYESHRPVADRMKARLLGYIRDVEGYVPEIVDAEERQGGQRRVSDAEVEM